MSQQPQFVDPDEDEHEDEGQPAPKGKKIPIAQLKAEREQYMREAEEGRKARQELAAIKAGLDPSDPKFPFFVAGYQGEWTEDAVKEAAVAAGFLAPPAPTTPPAEQEAHSRLLTASAPGAASNPQQWSEADVKRAFKEKRFGDIEHARETGLLNRIQGIDD